jgi:hypothetical protein
VDKLKGTNLSFGKDLFIFPLEKVAFSIAGEQTLQREL